MCKLFTISHFKMSATYCLFEGNRIPPAIIYQSITPANVESNGPANTATNLDQVTEHLEEVAYQILDCKKYVLKNCTFGEVTHFLA